MTKRFLSLMMVLGVTMLILAACGGTPTPAPTLAPAVTEAPTSAPLATESPTQAPSPSGDVALGGKLYDSWFGTVGVDAPEGDQPLWKTQTTNTRSGADTWRCKECHGWDYKGKDGAYGSGSHYTGFPGILSAKDKSAEELLAALKAGDHDFSKYLNEAQLNALVAFIQQLPDTSAYINADKTVNGDAAKGKVVFENTCKACHGEDGKLLNFGSEAEPEYVGTVAGNPWEAFHKISYGQPGAPMPAGVEQGWSWQDIADIVAYAQTLPAK